MQRQVVLLFLFSLQTFLLYNVLVSKEYVYTSVYICEEWGDSFQWLLASARSHLSLFNVLVSGGKWGGWNWVFNQFNAATLNPPASMTSCQTSQSKSHDYTKVSLTAANFYVKSVIQFYLQFSNCFLVLPLYWHSYTLYAIYNQFQNVILDALPFHKILVCHSKLRNDQFSILLKHLLKYVCQYLMFEKKKVQRWWTIFQQRFVIGFKVQNLL